MGKSIVRLNTEDREQVLALVTTGQAAAVKRLHARLLLKAAVDAGGRRGTDAESAEAWDTSAATLHRVRQAWVEAGLETALSRKRPTGRPQRKRDGGQEAQRLAVACRAPPAGRARWTRTCLAAKLGERDIVARLRAECVRTTRQHTHANRGSRRRG